MNPDPLLTYLEPFLGETVLKEAERLFNQAVAKRDEEIVRWDDLKKAVGIDSPLGFFDYVMAKDEWIAKLRLERDEARVATGFADVATERLEKRISQLEALLDGLHHNSIPGLGSSGCESDCPACAWAALKKAR